MMQTKDSVIPPDMMTPGHVHSSSLHSGSLHITVLLFSRCTKGMTTPSSCHSAAFLGVELLAYVIIPGLLVIWDQVLDHMEHGEETKKV